MKCLKYPGKLLLRHGGFTLIEVIIALAIILIPLLGLFSLFVIERKANVHADELFQADNLAYNILNDYIKNKDYESLVNLPDTSCTEAITVNNESVKTIEFIYNIKTEEITGNLKRLSIYLRWHSRGMGTDKISITSYVYK